MTFSAVLDIRKTILGFFAVALISINVLADVSYRSPVYRAGVHSPATITIFGMIQPLDLQSFRQALQQVEQDASQGKILVRTASGFPAFVTELNSRGGSFVTALLIGGLVHASEGRVVVHQDAICASSCVFILAGGVTRYSVGKIGIHRPYDSQDETTDPARQKSKYAKIEKAAKAYLDSVNVPSRLYDLMIRIPPERIRWLSQDELTEYGLNEDDPYYQEAENTKTAKSFGISKARLMKIYADMDRACKNSVESDECVWELYR
ncbi:hypothetical protein [Propionivibrio sp.]|uniref:COG3904 family protein n=1 Tax=Propionivibrio sp. TaxID=2212460 RepID=UPI0039E644A4